MKDEGVTAAPGDEPSLKPSDSMDVPEHLFYHVEKSLSNGIKEDMLLEILHGNDPPIFWIGKITMVCGHLLRVRYIGDTKDFWCDINESKVHQLGWCVNAKMTLGPPKEISEKIGDQLIPLMRESVENNESVPEESLAGKGLSPIDLIKIGMKVEIRNDENPYEFWVATVLENIGGRLKVKYDAPENTGNEFWLFYTSPRLQNVGFCNSKGSPYKLQHPKTPTTKKFELKFWNECLKSAIRMNEEMPFPKSVLFEHDLLMSHDFKIGMKLEAVNPANMTEICPAYVSRIFDDFYFLVILDSCSESDGTSHWVCHAGFPYIFPVGWAQMHGIEVVSPHQKNIDSIFDWKKCLEPSQLIPAPTNYFPKSNMTLASNFIVGMKLEAVDPTNPSHISTATIVQVAEHLLLINLDYTGKSYWYAYDSLNIFPIGWCSSNNIQVFESKVENIEIPKRKPENRVSPPIIIEQCCRIFFNYKCYSGPLISKNKLSQLPKHVGPGPLSLVIREVLNMIISVAYKPARLLRDWEYEGKARSDVTLEVLKAKLKSSTHRANVQVIDKCEDLAAFCKEMCGKLQACPYLFGPTQITDQCPEQCHQANKLKFRKKRRKRGVHFMTIRARERRAALENEALSKDGAESGNESDQSLPSTPHHSESGTRPNTPDSNSDPPNKKQRRKREPRTNIPPMEMKTRGAKLPNFALQMKEGHWNRKDVETIYNNTCVVPRKQFSDDSESDNNSNSNSSETKNIEDIERISDVSDSEEPELKKLRVTPINEQFQFDSKAFGFSDSSASIQSSNNCETNYVLQTDPSTWTVEDVHKYLMKFEDCREVARKLKDEEIDGLAFIMLNLPTMREHLRLKNKPALTLCKHVANLKCLFYSQNSNISF